VKELTREEDSELVATENIYARTIRAVLPIVTAG
jgi:hypothetical protein